MEILYTLHRGNAPLIIDIPHAGIYIPLELRARMTPMAQTLPDTDWHVPLLYDFARALDVTLMAATHSRYVIDLNRDPAGVALYPGASNTEVCPTTTFHDQPVYLEGQSPTEAEIATRRVRYFDPYHAVLAEEIARLKALHGYAVLLDGHSIASHVPRFFDGALPDLNLGTADGASCAPSLQAVATTALVSVHSFSLVVNGRFKGGWITRHSGQPASEVHALQLEIAQSAYMEEGPPYAWQPWRAQRLVDVLRLLIVGLLGWSADAEA